MFFAVCLKIGEQYALSYDIKIRVILAEVNHPCQGPFALNP
jgi:hypothetical protein